MAVLFYRSVGKAIHSDTVFATSSDSRNDAIATTVVLLGALITRFTSVNLDGFWAWPWRCSLWCPASS